MEVQKEQTVQQLNIASIAPDPNQPRKTFNEQSLKLLSENISQYGVIAHYRQADRKGSYHRNGGAALPSQQTR